MKITISKNVSDRYPEYKMGVIEAVVSKYDIDALQKLLPAKYADGLKRNKDAETKWNQVFSEMKASSKRLSSVVSLWNLFERYDELRSINYFVDVYNYISVKYGIPMGGYDTENLPAADITLDYAKKGDKFQPLGLNQTEKIKDESEIVYYSGSDVICRYWNNKDSEITKITESTSKLVIIFDFFGDDVHLNAAMDEMEVLLKETSDVPYLQKNILTADNPTIDVNL